MVRWAALLLFLGCSETPRTEVILVVDSDIPVPSGLDQIDVLVTGPEMRMESSMAMLGADQPPLPRTLGLVHGGDALGPFEAVVTGTVGGVTVVTRRAVFSFVRKRTLVLTMHLTAACRAVDCGSDRTCTEDGCMPVARGALPAWTGTPPRLAPQPDGGTDAAEDAPTDVPVDTPTDVPTDVPPDVAPDVPSDTNDSCVPTAEICNDLDDDCDTDVDEEFDLMKDEMNCGFCGNVCIAPTDTCCSGTCAVDTGMMGGC